MTSFSDDVISAVLTHMNDDHVDDNLVIVRAFAEPNATAVRMTGLDDQRSYWSVTVGEHTTDASIPWPSPITERPQIRRATVELYRAACRKLGVAPRTE